MDLSFSQRRGPIAAEFAGPGPAAITLPILFGSEWHLTELFNLHLILADPHIKESTKLKAPAYTFGGRFKSTTDKLSPSPNSYNTTGLTKKGRKMWYLKGSSVYVSGKCNAPANTLHVKLRDLKKFSTPSPSSYNPNTADKGTRKTEPSFSFGMKTEKGPGTGLCPAPNAYSVPAIKESPAYSLAARVKENKTAIVPGPGTYEVSIFTK